MNRALIMVFLMCIYACVVSGLFIRRLKKARKERHDFAENVKARGARTTGTCVSSYFEEGYGSTRSERIDSGYWVYVYEYTVDGVAYRVTAGWKPRLGNNGMRTVYYDPSDPSKAVVDVEDSNKTYSLALYSLVVIFVVAMLFLAVFWEIIGHRPG